MKLKKRAAMSLVEVMIVISIIGIIVAIAAPTWWRQREVTRVRACQENLSKIDEAKELYAMEFRLPNGSAIDFPGDLVRPEGVDEGKGYLRKKPECPASGDYEANAVGTDPTCSVGENGTPFGPHVLSR